MAVKKNIRLTTIAAALSTCVGLLACDSDLPTDIASYDPGQPIDGPLVGGGSDSDDDPTNDGVNGSSDTAGGQDNTHDHMPGLGTDTRDPFDVLAQRQEEGPPEVRSRLHSCQKPQIAALRRMLASFGVDLDATGNPDPAGELLAKGSDALGGANYNARTGEAITWTNSGATKFQDIFIMAAPEIIAALPTVEHCQIDGVGPEMFDEEDRCNPDAISCLIGRPATEEHVAICSSIVGAASSPAKGKAIAVAALLAAAHTCE